MRKVLVGTPVFFFIAFVAVIGVFLLRSDDPDLATEAPLLPIPTAAADVTPTTAADVALTAAADVTPTTAADVTPTTAADVALTAAPTVTPTGTATLDLPARVRRFVIDPSGSSAKYVVKENLRLVETTAVGETTAISGEIYLSPDGLYDDATSSFTVDLRELKSDESRRDSYINRTTLDTSSFPFAEFVVESITGFPTDYVENTQVELTLSGSMTIHGVSQPMTFSVLARQAGNSLSAVADADFKMTDFGIEPPSVTIATARDEVHIQLVLLALEFAP